jgi:hypothetical protein
MATPFVWKMDFKQGATWTTLPSLQNVSIFRGRRLQIDDYSIDTMTVESEFPSSWSVTPKLGDQVVAYIYKPGVVVGTDNFAAFWGRIRDVKINYGYTTNMDRVTIECEGIQADWGRAQLTNYALASALTDSQVNTVGAAIGANPAAFTGRSTGSAQTFTGNGLELLNTITRTEEARFYAGSITYQANPALYWFGRNTAPPTTYYWNDGTGTPYVYEMKYEQIEFRSSADNYYNSITVSPNGLAAQTATLSETPLYGWQLDTIDNTTTQALSHAQWLLNNYQSKDSTLASITFTDVQQTVSGYPPPNDFNVNVIQAITSAVNQQGIVYFRGGTYNVILEGISVNATPGQTRVTIFFSGRDTNAYLILNNTQGFGTLDNNRLGF